MESILTSIKKLLGIAEEYTHFDQDIIMQINSALFDLTQLGVGPSAGFIVLGKTQTWSEFLADRKDLELVKTAVYLRVRLMFDPPQNSFLVSSIQKQIEEFDWRITATAAPVVEVVTVDYDHVANVNIVSTNSFSQTGFIK